MPQTQLKHFLVIYDIPNGVAEIIDSFGMDYDAALTAYADAEQRHKDNEDVEVVLLGSDSAATLERTHSSYFELREKHLDRVVARELAALGLS